MLSSLQETAVLFASATVFSLAILSAFVLIALPKNNAAQRLLEKVEASFAAFSRHQTFAMLALFFSVIALRLSVLHFLPVPIPGIHDEFSYLLMGDTFAHGRLANPSHPMWRSFDTFHENWLPTYSSMYPPAQGLLLAFGQILGNPWIGVLLSDAAMCAAIFWMLQAWVPRKMGAAWRRSGRAKAGHRQLLDEQLLGRRSSRHRWRVGPRSATAHSQPRAPA